MNGDSDSDSGADDNQLDKLKNTDLADLSRFTQGSGWDDPDDFVDSNVIEPNATPESQILWAANEGRKDLIMKCLREHPNVVNTVDTDGYTPLHRACYNNFVDIASYLIQKNANVNACTEMKWTPLHSASKWGHCECAILLLSHGANPNAISEGGQTPLHIAASVSNTRDVIITLLLHPDIKPNLLNNSSERAVDIAKRSGNLAGLFEISHDAFNVEAGLID